MADLTPIDHKDSDPGYRAAVRGGIETVLGAKLKELDSAESLLGDWNRTFPRIPNASAERFSYFADGTFSAPYDSEGSPRGFWTVEDGVYTETTWGEPIPEYDIHEGTWNPTTYHCAVTDAGEVVIWNGDGSLVLLLTRLTQDPRG